MPDEVNPYAVSESSLQLQPEAETFPMGLASRVRRLGAVAIDGAIIGIADYLVSLPAYLGVNPFSTEAQVLNLISGFGIFLLVNGYTLQTRGQTIGKLILGIRIVDAKSGELAGLPRIAVLREFPLWLTMYAWYELGMPYAVVDACFIFGQQRRCLHDFIAGTKVVIVPKRSPNLEVDSGAAPA